MLQKQPENNQERIVFTKEMKKDYTILMPMMLPIHFELIRNALRQSGYNAELLKTENPEIAQIGLKYVHNDTCYPAILVIGQFIEALASGKYDPNKTALMITQTGGGCRASNYIHLLRKALKKSGYENVPVISLNISGLEKNSGFSLTLPLLRKMMFCLFYGDCLMNLHNQVNPYEVNKGQTDMLVSKWVDKLSCNMENGDGFSKKQFRMNIEQMADDFSNIKQHSIPKIKVGIVGEIYIKYSSLGNNGLESYLVSQECEICVPGILGFMLFKIDNRIDDIKLYGGNKFKSCACKLMKSYLTSLEKIYADTINSFGCFSRVPLYEETRKQADGVIGYGNKMGEGWFLTAEIIELIKSGYQNIVCAQPFGCLPNHICGKGMIHKINKLYPQANIVTIDYDASVSRVNQENRIKLMLSVSK